MQTLTLSVDNVRGIERETLVIPSGEVTQVTRRNAGGKTTLAMCAAACLSRDPSPLGTFGVSENRWLIRAGADAAEAHAALSGDDWSIVWHVSQGTFTETGPVPKIPALCARATSDLIRGERRVMGEHWLAALDARPLEYSAIYNAIMERIGSIDGAEQWAKRQSEELATRGDEAWKIAHELAADRALEAKRQWENVVATAGEHEDYGAAKASNWRPFKGWSPDLEGATIAGCDAALHATRHAVEELRKRKAAIVEGFGAHDRALQKIESLESQIAELQKAASEIEPPEGEVDDAMIAEHNDLEREIELLRTEAAASDKGADEARMTWGAANRALREARGLSERYHAAVENHERCEKSAQAIIEATPDGETCKTCGQSIGHLPDVLETYERRVETIKADSEKRTRQIAELKAEIGQLPVELSAAHDTDTWPVATYDKTHEEAAAETRTRIRELEAKRSHLADKIATTKAGPAIAERKKANLEGRIETLQAQVANEQNAAAALRADADGLEAVSDDEIAAATDVYETARRNRKLVEIVQDATNANDAAVAWGMVSDVLSPTKGIRAQRLDDALDKINADAASVCNVLDLPKVEIRRTQAGTVSLHMNDCPLVTLSGAEQWAAQVAVRAALSIQHNAPLFVCDTPDAFDSVRKIDALTMLESLAARTGMAVLSMQQA